MKGIEPSSKAWEAFVLPLNYTRLASPVLTGTTAHRNLTHSLSTTVAGQADSGRFRIPPVHGSRSVAIVRHPFQSPQTLTTASPRTTSPEASAESRQAARPSETKALKPRRFLFLFQYPHRVFGAAQHAETNAFPLNHLRRTNGSSHISRCNKRMGEWCAEEPPHATTGQCPQATKEDPRRSRFHYP